MNTLIATKRSKATKLADIRKSGSIPAVVYGGGIENLHIEIDRNTFGKIYSDLSESTLIDLALAGGEPQVERQKLRADNAASEQVAKRGARPGGAQE